MQTEHLRQHVRHGDKILSVKNQDQEVVSKKIQSHPTKPYREMIGVKK